MQKSLSLAVLAIAGLVVAGCPSSSAPRGAHDDKEGADGTPVGSSAMVWSPAFTHGNLTVFVATSRDHDDTDFMTLDEGLKAGSVVVSEKGGAEASAQVNELEIENVSDRPVFVQVGDRLKGGKQDRIVGQSFVLAPHSGKLPVRSFCIEHDCWRGDGRAQFKATEELSAAPQKIRLRALEKDQQGVWDGVAHEKQQAARELKSANTNSSLNETLDSPEIKKATDAYVAALGKVLEGKKDAVGVAFAVNGKVVEVDLYPGPTLLGKLYPKLLASFAYQAATDKKADCPVVASKDVEAFIAEGVERSKRHEDVNANALLLIDYDKKVQAETEYNGKKITTHMAK